MINQWTLSILKNSCLQKCYTTSSQAKYDVIRVNPCDHDVLYHFVQFCYLLSFEIRQIKIISYQLGRSDKCRLIFVDKCLTIQTRRQLVYTNVTNSVTISSAFSLLSLCGYWVFQYYITVSSFDCPNSINMETLWLEDICTSVLYILRTITYMYKDSYRDH